MTRRKRNRTVGSASSHQWAEVMKRLALTLLAATLASCSRPTDPCIRDGPAPGAPAFDLASALRNAGAVVQERGQRLDLTLLSVPTEVLDVDGQEVLMWRYCTGGQFTHDIGLYGIGVEATNPAVIVVSAQTHLFTMGRVVASYVGQDTALIGLLTEVMGSELELP